MIIRNRFVATVLTKILRLKPKRISFVYIDEKYDPELTELAFLNQSLARFDEQVELFRAEVQDAIQEILSKGY